MPRPLLFHCGIGSVTVCALHGLCEVVNTVSTLSVLLKQRLLALPSCDLIPVATIPSPQISELTAYGFSFYSIAGSSAAIAAYCVDLSQVKSLGSLYNLS